MKNALIAGGTGLIGTRLSQLLTERGYGVAHLSRKSSPKATFPTFSWDPSRRQIDPEALQNVSVLINLAGAGIADGRWTDRRKELIIRSRVESTLFLKETIEGSAGQIDTYLCTSAIGYYGNRGDEWLTEDSKPGKGFLPQSTQQWEKAIDEVRTTCVRTLAFRTGIAALGVGLQPPFPRAHQGDLAHGEHPVQEHQQQQDQELHGQAKVGDRQMAPRSVLVQWISMDANGNRPSPLHPPYELLQLGHARVLRGQVAQALQVGAGLAGSAFAGQQGRYLGQQVQAAGETLKPA